MTDDIVNDLRKSKWNENPDTNVSLCEDAANEIERWRNIAKELHTWLLPDWEDWETAKAGVYAMEMYEKAIRGG